MQNVYVIALAQISVNDIRSLFSSYRCKAVMRIFERFVFKNTVIRHISTICVDQMYDTTKMRTLQAELICITLDYICQLLLNICWSYIKICSDITVHNFDMNGVAVENLCQQHFKCILIGRSFNDNEYNFLRAMIHPRFPECKRNFAVMRHFINRFRLFPE